MEKHNEISTEELRKRGIIYKDGQRQSFNSYRFGLIWFGLIMGVAIGILLFTATTAYHTYHMMTAVCQAYGYESVVWGEYQMKSGLFQPEILTYLKCQIGNIQAVVI